MSKQSKQRNDRSRSWNARIETVIEQCEKELQREYPGLFFYRLMECAHGHKTCSYAYIDIKTGWPKTAYGCAAVIPGTTNAVPDGTTIPGEGILLLGDGGAIVGTTFRMDTDVEIVKVKILKNVRRVSKR